MNFSFLTLSDSVFDSGYVLMSVSKIALLTKECVSGGGAVERNEELVIKKKDWW